MKKALLSLSALLTVGVVNAQTVQRVPLFEVFTSETCPPCKPGNTIYENVIAPKPKGDYVSIKFQQDFPGNGDPYCTTEGVNRRSYYAINSIPRMEIDGGWDQNAQSFTDALYTQYRSVAAKATLTGVYSISTSNRVTVKVDYKAIGSAFPAGTKLYVGIVEARTIKNINAQTNGETVFYNVMKKMMPTDGGTAVTALAAGASESKTMTFTFTGSYRLPADGKTANRIALATEHSVEHFDSLKVVAWIQGSTKEVFQAGNLSKVAATAIANVSNSVGEVMVFPNPSSSNVNVSINMKSADNVTAVIYNMNGAAVITKTANLAAGAGQIGFDVSNLAAGLYNLVIFDSNNNSFSERLSVAH